jgi:hypothetical protein
VPKKPFQHQAPSGALRGTVWFGGPVSRFKITLRIMGDSLDPEQITAILKCPPSRSETKGKSMTTASGHIRIPKRGHWALSINSKDYRGEEIDLEQGLRILLGKLPSDSKLWRSLTTKYDVDLFCGLFLETSNRGFELSAKASTMLSRRYLKIGFDVYFDPHSLPE